MENINKASVKWMNEEFAKKFAKMQEIETKKAGTLINKL
jgi:hypothetical protein